MYNQMPYMMNYPYMNMANTGASLSGASKLSNLLSKINFSSILTNTQKTLNVVNQAIPLYHQVKPVVSNIKALGKIGKEFTKMNNTTTTNNNNNNNTNNTQNNNINNSLYDNVPNPTFFI